MWIPDCLDINRCFTQFKCSLKIEDLPNMDPEKGEFGMASSINCEDINWPRVSWYPLMANWYGFANQKWLGLPSSILLVPCSFGKCDLWPNQPEIIRDLWRSEDPGPRAQDHPGLLGWAQHPQSTQSASRSLHHACRRGPSSAPGAPGAEDRPHEIRGTKQTTEKTPYQCIFKWFYICIYI